MTTFEAPISDTSLYLLAATCLTVGGFCSSLFVASLAIRSKSHSNLIREGVLGVAASITLGLGLVFGLLSSGVWI